MKEGMALLKGRLAPGESRSDAHGRNQEHLICLEGSGWSRTLLEAPQQSLYPRLLGPWQQRLQTRTMVFQ